MNKKFIPFLFLFVFSLSLTYVKSQTIAEGVYNNEYIKYYKNKLILSYKSDSLNNNDYIDGANEFIVMNGGSIDSIYSSAGFMVVDLTFTSFNADAINIIDDFINSGLFEFVCLNGVIEPNFVTPNDPLYQDQWYLNQNRGPEDPNHDIDADKAWAITKGDHNRAQIYNVDTGIRAPNFFTISHEDLISFYLRRGNNYSTDLLGINDVYESATSISHGTKISGLLAGTQDNQLGISGLAPHCDNIVDKVYHSTGSHYDYFIQAIRQAVRFKIGSSWMQVIVSISSSMSGVENYLPFTRILDSARTFNVIIVVSAGNSSTGNGGLVTYPARYANTYSNVISVGATDINDVVGWYSCIARLGTNELTLIAPGGSGLGSGNNMITTNKSGFSQYGTVSGTSFSSPLVAGCIGLMSSVKRDLTPAQIKSKLIRTVEKVEGMNGANYTLEYGYGRLNAFNAVVSALDSISGTISPNPNPWSLDYSLRMEDEITIAPQCTIIVQPGSSLILDENAELTFGQFAKIIVRGGATFIQRRGSTIDDRAEILLDPGSHYYIEDGANLNIVGQGPGGPNDYGCIAIWGGTLHIEDNAKIILDDGGFMGLKKGGRIVMGNNSSLIFGAESYLDLDSGTSILFGENSELRFTENSYIYADTEDTSHVYFSGITPQTRWNGIFIDSSLTNDTLEKCIFNGAKTAVTITNSATSSNVDRIFEHVTFNIPEGDGNKGIYSENAHKITIEDCEFNMPNTSTNQLINVGIFLKNTSTASNPVIEDPEGAGVDPDNEMMYILNIVDNTFKKGSASIVLANYTSNYLPYMIKGNTFDSAVSSLNILGMKIGGTIKNNMMASMQTPLGVHLINSNPDFYNNTIAARDVALHLAGHSYPNLAPVFENNQMKWRGGKNHLSSYLIDAAQLVAAGNIFSDYGYNRFSASNSGYHIYGWVDSTVSTYYSRNNCWYRPGSTVANINLTRPPSQQIPIVTYNYYYDCTTEPYPNEWEVDYWGHGISDSVMVSDNDIGMFPDEDGQVYVQSLDFYGNDQFIDGIVNFKYLIDNFPSSDYLESSLYYLYGCHENLDTSASQSYINTLFGNLKIYLEEKIGSDSYNTEFEDVAYDFKVMCDAKLQNFNEASNGYEFIALFHPDPDIRLTASWNYNEIQAILNTGSGGSISNTEQEEVLEKRLIRMEKLIISDPILKKMKESFVQVSKQREEATQRFSLSSNGRSTDINKIKELERIKNERARQNLLTLKTLDKENLEKRRLEDLILTTKNLRNETIDQDNNIPIEYELLQNYPNPFNPYTTIEYQIPEDQLVQLKIFDILGREILTLVNELKFAGKHTVTLNGQNLPSGIYFYKLKTGKFEQTKRMVLIK